MRRYGKIARLPRELREQLNHRINNGEPAVNLVPWVNAQPGVAEILAAEFDAVPISEQNMSNWVRGGFLEWLGVQEWKAVCSSCVEEAGDVAATGFSAQKLLLHLTARVANIVHSFDQDRLEHFPEIIALQRLIGTLQKVHQSDQKDARIAIDRERLELQKQRAKTSGARTTEAAAAPTTLPAAAPAPEASAAPLPRRRETVPNPAAQAPAKPASTLPLPRMLGSQQNPYTRHLPQPVQFPSHGSGAASANPPQRQAA